MNFDFSDEQKELRDTVRRFLAEHCPPDRVRAISRSGEGYDRELWRELGRLGVLGAAIPEAYGGSGAGYLEACVVAEELGRTLAPVPFSSMAQATQCLLLAGSEEQKQRHLPGIAAGEKIAAVALHAPAGTLHVRGGRLYGAVPVMADAGIADLAVIAAEDAGALRLGLVGTKGSGVEVHDRPSLDLTQCFARVTFDGAAFEPIGAASDAPELVSAVRDCAAVLLAFEQVGGTDRTIEMARDYALERRAFGRPIGSFQAIKHMLADMFVAAALARSNAYYAAWTLASGSAELAVAAATARVSATHAFELGSKNNIQVHGGIGFTWELDCHLFYRRSNGLARRLGSIASWEERLVCLLDREAA